MVDILIGNKAFKVKIVDKNDIAFLEIARYILVDKQKDSETADILNESAIKYINCAITVLETRNRK